MLKVIGVNSSGIIVLFFSVLIVGKLALIVGFFGPFSGIAAVIAIILGIWALIIRGFKNIRILKGGQVCPI